MALTDIAISNAKAGAKPYKMGDSLGLFLLVQPTGGKLWRVKFRVDGREKKLAIGTYPEVSLADARKRLLSIKSTITPGAEKMQNQTDNPMQPEPANLMDVPRCLARTRSGTACRSPAINGKARCRMHGGKGSGAPSGNRNAWKHGARSADAMNAAAYLKAMARLLDGCD